MMFDENNIVLSFAAVSDTHITGDAADDSEFKLRRAVTQICEKANSHGHGIDAFLVVGDLIDRSWKEPEMQMKAFEDIYSSLSRAPLFYCLGASHDLYWGSESEAEFIANFRRHLGEKNFVFDIDEESIAKGNRHALINGYHFIALEPCSRGPITYPEETKMWLCDILESTKDDGKYVFIITHAMITDTCYGSLLGPDWATEDLTPILSKYPNAVVFGGHLHFPIQDERSIMQKDFTSVGCGSVRYMAIEDAAYENMMGKTVMRDSYRVSSGHLCEVDAGGALRITRLDFAKNAEIKSPWTLPAPQSGGAHLSHYRPERKESAESPRFPDDFSAKAEFSEAESGYALKLTFTAAEDGDMVHHYTALISRADGSEKEYRILADFYRHASPSDMAREITLAPKDVFLRGEKLSVRIKAFNSWGKESNEKEFFLIVE